MKMDWIVINEDDPNSYPPVDEDGCSDFIILSFDNASIPCIGRYEKHKDGSAAFYDGDDDRTLLSWGLIVNAWMPYPKPYRREE